MAISDKLVDQKAKTPQPMKHLKTNIFLNAKLSGHLAKFNSLTYAALDVLYKYNIFTI